jgi:hypothetical protein
VFAKVEAQDGFGGWFTGVGEAEGAEQQRGAYKKLKGLKTHFYLTKLFLS